MFLFSKKLSFFNRKIGEWDWSHFTWVLTPDNKFKQVIQRINSDGSCTGTHTTFVSMAHFVFNHKVKWHFHYSMYEYIKHWLEFFNCINEKIRIYFCLRTHVSVNRFRTMFRPHILRTQRHCPHVCMMFVTVESYMVTLETFQ